LYVLYAYIRVCIHLCVYACRYICMYICNFQVGFWAVRGGIVLVGRGSCPEGKCPGGKCPFPRVSCLVQYIENLLPECTRSFAFTNACSCLVTGPWRWSLIVDLISITDPHSTSSRTPLETRLIWELNRLVGQCSSNMRKESRQQWIHYRISSIVWHCVNICMYEYMYVCMHVW